MQGFDISKKAHFTAGSQEQSYRIVSSWTFGNIRLSDQFVLVRIHFLSDIHFRCPMLRFDKLP